jgi:hypothetical protein
MPVYGSSKPKNSQQPTGSQNLVQTPVLRRGWESLSFNQFAAQHAFQYHASTPVTVEGIPGSLLPALYFLLKASGKGLENVDEVPPAVDSYEGKLVKVHPLYEEDKDTRKHASTMLTSMLFDIVSSSHRSYLHC